MSMYVFNARKNQEFTNWDVEYSDMLNSYIQNSRTELKSLD